MCTLNASKINFATFKKEFDLKDLKSENIMIKRVKNGKLYVGKSF